MKYYNIAKLSALIICAMLCICACTNNDYDKIGKTEVTIETERGDIVLRLYDDTPEYRDNFIRLIKQGAYDGTVWHRVVKDGLIQAGTIDEARFANATIQADIKYPRHFHKAGALAAARENDDVNPKRNSSNTQFYIVTGKVYTPGTLAEEHQTIQDCTPGHTIAPFTDIQKKIYTTVGGMPSLDGRYTVFGEVVEGLNIAMYYGRQRTIEEKPVKKLVIKRITVTERP